jgi:hypothetical protein
MGTVTTEMGMEISSDNCPICIHLWDRDGNRDTGLGWDLSVASDHAVDNLRLRRPASPMACT